MTQCLSCKISLPGTHKKVAIDSYLRRIRRTTRECTHTARLQLQKITNKLTWTRWNGTAWTIALCILTLSICSQEENNNSITMTIMNKVKLKKMKLWMHSNLTLKGIAPVVLSCFWPNSYRTWTQTGILPAFDKNSDIAIRFSDPNFLKDSNNFAIRLQHLTKSNNPWWHSCLGKFIHIRALYIWHLPSGAMKKNNSIEMAINSDAHTHTSLVECFGSEWRCNLTSKPTCM